MKPEKTDYVRHRMALAREALEVAETALAQNHLHSCVNRLYYACFYAVSALLFAEGHTASKHSGIRSLFNRHWIKTGRLPVEMSRFYRDLFNHRQEGDYGDFTEFAQDEVSAWLDEAQTFSERVSQEIEMLP